MTRMGSDMAGKQLIQRNPAEKHVQVSWTFPQTCM